MIAASYPAVMRLLLNNQAPLMQLFQHYAVRCAVECRCATVQKCKGYSFPYFCFPVCVQVDEHISLPVFRDMAEVMCYLSRRDV